MTNEKKSIFRWLDSGDRNKRSESTQDIHESLLAENEGADRIESSEREGQSAPSRWVQGNVDISPYGFADDDGTTRQIESVTWRRAFGNKSRSRYFVPASKQGSSNATAVSPKIHTRTVQTGRFRSLLLWQCGFAAVLLFSGVYAHQSSQPIAAHVDRLFAQVFDTDYTSVITPKVDEVFAQYHVSLPTFGGASTGATMNAPSRGTITADYVANTHPEIWFSAPAQSPVVAAGTGVVEKVQPVGTGQYLVEINHGKVGHSLYVGMNNVTVRLGETVYAGQVIGRLPSQPERPILRFSMLKNNHFENPHDFIQFAVSAG
jgi:Peptidase family M23